MGESFVILFCCEFKEALYNLKSRVLPLFSGLEGQYFVEVK